jgi:hypothetical protein
MKKIISLEDLMSIEAGLDGTIEVKHKDGSYWKTRKVEIKDGFVYASYYPGSVENAN